jgi:hypothetical protein
VIRCIGSIGQFFLIFIFLTNPVVVVGGVVVVVGGVVVVFNLI